MTTDIYPTDDPAPSDLAPTLLPGQPSSAPTSIWKRRLPLPFSLRDTLRTRLDARRFRLHNAAPWRNLPAPVATLIQTVVGRTRLWPREKRDVARELCAHFIEGLAAGESSATLIQSFGNPRSAARLIRRAKKRNRPLLWHAARRTIHLGILLTIFVLVCASYLRSLHPSVKRNITAELNAPILATPEPDRAWPLYREALFALPARPDSVRFMPLSAGHYHPVAQKWSEIVQYIRDTAPILERIRQASMRPVLGYPLTDHDDLELLTHELQQVSKDKSFSPLGQPPANDNPPATTLVINYAGRLRQLASLISVDAQIAATDDDHDRFMRDVATTLAIAQHVRETNFTISQLVGDEIDEFVMDLIADQLELNAEFFDVPALRRLDRDMQSLDYGPFSFARCLATERACFEDLLQHTFSDDGTGGGRLTFEGYRELSTLITSFGLNHQPIKSSRSQQLQDELLTILKSDRRKQLERYDQINEIALKLFNAPPWILISNPPPEFVQLCQWPLKPIDYSDPASIFQQYIEHGKHALDLTSMHRDATRVILALHIFHAAHQRWPQTLAELVPADLPAVPLDAFDGHPLRYRVQANCPLLYSVGPDMVDNGGVPIESDRHPGSWSVSTTNIPSGDLIFFPLPPNFASN